MALTFDEADNLAKKVVKLMSLEDVIKNAVEKISDDLVYEPDLYDELLGRKNPEK